MTMRRRTRDFEVFSMSFLDTITCAFGSIILLFMLSKFGAPKALEKAKDDLKARVLALQQELHDIKGETEILNRNMTARERQLSEVKLKLARLRGDLSDVRGKYKASTEEAEVSNKLEGQLVAAQQQLTEEMKKLLGADFRRPPNDAVAGLPVDSEYIIFIIDTSGSMANYEWPQMLAQAAGSARRLPDGEGLAGHERPGHLHVPVVPWQVAAGHASATQARARRGCATGFRSVPRALRTGSSRPSAHTTGTGQKISLYVFGDEFTGPSIDTVVRTVDMINREDKNGERLVRIHALGFPVRPDAPQFTSIRFASLMRVLCARNGGTFVGLNEPNSSMR